MNDTTTQKPINVLTVGMDRRKQAMFRMAFEMHTLHRYQLYEPGMEGKPDLAILDFDTPDAAALWNEFCAEYPNLPALIVTTIQRDDAPAPVLLKPIRLESLFPQLRQLLTAAAPKHGPMPVTAKTAEIAPAQPEAPAETMADAQAAAEPTPAPSRPVAAPAVSEATPQTAAEAPIHTWPKRLERFDPRIGLLGALLKIKRSQTPGVVSIAGTKAIIVLPAQDRALLLQPEASLKQACLNTTTLVVTTPLSPEDQIDAKSVSLNSLIWQVSLWTSRGRLLAGFPEQGAVQLRYWPNLTRLAPTANALRIAAFWVRAPATLPLTQRMLNIPHTELFDFLAASYSIGILDLPHTPAKPAASKVVTEAELGRAPTPRPEPQAMPARPAVVVDLPPPPASPPPQPRGGLLSRLLKKIAGL